MFNPLGHEYAPVSKGFFVFIGRRRFKNSRQDIKYNPSPVG